MADRLGVVGGTFNPVHLGHLILAERVRETLNLDKILFIPTGKSVNKDVDISGAHRLEMTRLACEGNEFFEASDIDISRGGPSYTIFTAKDLRKEYRNEIYFITGTDAFLQIEKWLDFMEVLALLKFAVVIRPGVNPADVLPFVSKIVKEYGADVSLVDIPLMDVSSTEIRERLKAGKSVKYLVPENVLSYINENRLY